MNSIPSFFISIIIIAWNSKLYLHTCFDRLLNQTFHDFEVILVDNGSKDGTVEGLRDKYPSLNLRIVSLPSNHGFAVANNIGAHLARGQWLALLNADAFPEPDWLEQLLSASENNPRFSFFTSRQIQANVPDLLDGAGDTYHVSGLAWRRDYNQPVNENKVNPQEVFSACAAAALYSRDDFLKVGGFDEDYFSYFEDVDLGFRLRLVGRRCLYVPQAVVHHIGSASTGKLSDFAVYHGHRNLVWTYLKNMPPPLFWLYLPLHLLMNLFFLLSFTFKGKGKAIFKAKWDAICQLSSILKKRRTVQEMRTTTATDIYRVMSKGLLDPYLASRQRKREGKSQ
ncbi:MAG: glycosyltransferase family 2 protein [Chloroflexi bacterium]|nr:glycosyltransferase family 2 protein [Chloroflexota bacterium]